jgi:perosamine synthetase
MSKIFLDEADLGYIPSTIGEDVQKFEKAMAEYLGVSEVVATNSGTSALHLALLACGIGRKDTVVVPATTFVATGNAVLYTGAKVELVDVDSENWCLPAGVYKRARAVVPVSLYGCKPYLSIRPKGSVIHDFAEAIHFRSMADWGCYSFNGNKTMTTGGGGMVAGRDLDVIRQLIKPAYHNGMAYNYGMPAHNARLGLEQLKKLPEYLEKKTTFNKIYREELDFLKFQKAEPGPCWMTAALFPEWVNIEQLQIRLQARGIPTRRIFKPLNHYPQFEAYTFRGPIIYTNAEYLYKHGLCLPSSTKNSPEDIYKVCKTIKKLI